MWRELLSQIKNYDQIVAEERRTQSDDKAVGGRASWRAQLTDLSKALNQCCGLESAVTTA